MAVVGRSEILNPGMLAGGPVDDRPPAIFLADGSIGRRRSVRVINRTGWTAAALAIAAGLILCGCRKEAGSDSPGRPVHLDEATLQKKVAALRKQNDQLQTRLNKLVPKDPYIVINTTLNRIQVRKGEAILVDGACSTGSNTELVSPDGTRRWYFSTPRGVHKVINRRKNPVWAVPEWGRVEAELAGEELLPEDLFQRGVLGKYALDLGDGYMIHGTLFQRFLGLQVTHGCVRVGDEDLQQIWDLTRLGTPVYIF